MARLLLQDGNGFGLGGRGGPSLGGRGALDRSRVMAAAAAAGWLQRRRGLLVFSGQRPGRGGRGMGRRRTVLGAAASAGGLGSPGRGRCGGGGGEAQHRPGPLAVPPPPPCWRQEKGRDQLSGVPSPGNGDARLRPAPRSCRRRRRLCPPLQEREVPPRLCRLPPEPAASTVPRRSPGRGCRTVRSEDGEDATDAAAAAAAGRPARRGRCPRGCSRALRGALGRGRRRLSSPSPAPGLASQRLNSQTSIMAAASERGEPSRRAPRRACILPRRTKSPATSPPAAGPPPPPPRREPERLGRPRGGREGRKKGGGRAAPGEGRTGAARGGGRGQPRVRTPSRQAPLSMPSVADRGSLGPAPRRPPAARCTCRDCFCSHAGRGGQAEPRSAPRKPAGRGAGDGGALKVKAGAGAWSDVTDSGGKLPARRCTGTVAALGMGPGRAGTAPAAGTPLPLPPRLIARHGLRAGSGTAVGSQSFAEIWIRQPLPKNPPSRSVSSRCQSEHKAQPPIVSPGRRTSPAPFHRSTSRVPGHPALRP